MSQAAARWPAAAGLVLLACASPGMPPGGPPDSAPPEIVRVNPADSATDVQAKSVLIHFNEVVSERPAGRAGSAAGIEAIVLLSPSDGRERVAWRRTAIEITPRQGFRPNTAYRVTLLPGLADLRNNVRQERVSFTFSTGGSIPEGEVAGAVFDWVGGKVAPLAAIELFQASDTMFRWIGRADSLGRYVVPGLPDGEYLLRAWIDQNGDRRLGEREAFDSATIAVRGGTTHDLYTFTRDTLGPRLDRVDPIDSTGIRLRFDRAVAPSWEPEMSALRLQRADSSDVDLGVMMWATRFDSLRAAARDSVRAMVDTVRAAVDTLAERAPAMARPVPATEWAARLAAPLAPGEYRLTAIGIEGMSGTRRSSERVFRIREPAPPPADSAAAPTDTARGPAVRWP